MPNAEPSKPPPLPPHLRTPPPMDHAPGFKASAFTWAMGLLILERMAGGETIKEITADPRMPSYATVFRWTHVHEAFGRDYRRLRLKICQARLMVRDEADERARERRDRARIAAGKWPRDWVSGRKTTYTLTRAEAICEALEDGAALSQVLARPGMPSAKAVYRWLKNEPEFQAMYMQACVERDNWLDWQAMGIVEETTPATLRADKRRVAKLDGRRGRMRPKLYRAAD